jgi:hypothetical protein
MANEKQFKEILDEVINATKDNENPADLLSEEEQILLNDVNELLDMFDEKVKSLNARPKGVNREQWLARQIEKNVSRISNDEARQKITQAINDALPEVNDDYLKEEEETL